MKKELTICLILAGFLGFLSSILFLIAIVEVLMYEGGY